MSRNKIKIAIGIPNVGNIKAQTVFSLVRALKNFPHDYDVLFQEGSILHLNRERLAKKAMELNCTHLLFLDTDMVFEGDAITKLLKRNKDIIGVNYNRRRLPLEGTVVGKTSDKKLDTCDAVATGFMLIKTDVFRNLPHPWFFWETDTEGNMVTGEDYWFCRLARGHGYKVWVDLSVKVGHIGDYVY